MPSLTYISSHSSNVFTDEGKLLLTRTLAPQNGILELPRLTPGLNVATLRCDGIRIGVVKLSIVK